jgi:poly(hydroxyalkanoate) depolymerase family esterase
MKPRWETLYESNRAAIRRAGLPDPAVGVVASPTPTAGAPPAPERLSATVHAPPRLAPGAAVPLVCMLHGCTQDAASIAAATRMNDAADRHGFMVIYPQQSRSANQSGCWNWFLPEHQARGSGEPAAIATLVRELAGDGWTIDRRRVFLAGMSAGGAMAIILAATYPDLFAAVAVHSGLVYGAATNLGAAFAAMKQGAPAADHGLRTYAAMGPFARPLPSIVLHGTADETVAPVNGEQVLQQTMSVNRLAAPGLCDCDPAHPSSTSRLTPAGRHPYTRSQWTNARGELMHEALTVDGLGHAWSGGTPGGSFTDPRGPDATEAIWRFFESVTQAPPAAHLRALPSG